MRCGLLDSHHTQGILTAGSSVSVGIPGVAKAGEVPFAVWHVVEDGQRRCRVLPWGKGVMNLDRRHGCPTGLSYTFPCDRIGGSHISCGAGELGLIGFFPPFP